MSFVVYPAIDVRGGRVVRLRQGDYADETRYGDDPLALLASDHGDDNETSDDDADAADIDEDEFPDGLVLGEDAYDAARAHDARGEGDDRED